MLALQHEATLWNIENIYLITSRKAHIRVQAGADSSVGCACTLSISKHPNLTIILLRLNAFGAQAHPTKSRYPSVA